MPIFLVISWIFAITLPTSKQLFKFNLVLSFPCKKETMHAFLFFKFIKCNPFLLFRGFGQLILELFKISISFIKKGISLFETLFSKIVKINLFFFVFNK